MPRAVSIDPQLLVTGFHALSDPTRLEIIELLRHGERCVCELVDALGAAQSRLSFHLRVLKEAGLVADRREGRWVYYTLDPGMLEELGAYLAGVRTVRPSAHGGRRPSIICCD